MNLRKNLALFLFLLAPSMVSAQANSGGQPFTITIAAGATEVKAGTDVCIKVTLTNNSPHDLNMSAGLIDGIDVNPNYRFDIHDESGKLVQKRVYPHPELATGKPYSYFVKPNEVYVQSQCPSTLWDMQTPGKYTIQVFRRELENSRTPEIGSNVVTVTVLP